MQRGNNLETKSITSAITGQEWIDKPAEVVQKSVGKVFEAGGSPLQEFKDFLHGVWLGHPLHPVLTDIPIGAWTVAVALDLLDSVQGKEDLSPGADAAVAVGLAGAAGAAVTGLTDWHVMQGDPEPKRMGFSHMVFNVAATALFTSSLVMRKTKKRTAGRVLGLLGYAAATAGAYLGGKLVYDEAMGVDHAERDLPTGWITVANAKELKEGAMLKVRAGEVDVLLTKQKGKILAIGNKCSHYGGPLNEGELGEGCVTCPWHASTFSLEDGAVIHGPATFPQPTFATRVEGGEIQVKARH